MSLSNPLGASPSCLSGVNSVVTPLTVVISVRLLSPYVVAQEQHKTCRKQQQVQSQDQSEIYSRPRYDFSYSWRGVDEAWQVAQVQDSVRIYIKLPRCAKQLRHPVRAGTHHHLTQVLLVDGFRVESQLLNPASCVGRVIRKPPPGTKSVFTLQIGNE